MMEGVDEDWMDFEEEEEGKQVLGASKFNANLYCNCVYLYWEGCVMYSISYLR